MELVFSTKAIEPTKRFSAWQEAICDVYVNVDVNAENRSDYDGFIREAQFGPITMTDVLLSEQHISRRPRHIARLDKDCFYIAIMQQGKVNVLQRGETLATKIGVGAIFSASESYDLECIGKVRSLYLEVPREEFVSRISKDRIPVVATMGTGQGLGRIAAEFCSMLAAEAASLEAPARERLGHELMDVLALALELGDREDPGANHAVRTAQLRSVKVWIEEHLADRDLSPEAIAKANGLSLRRLHYLFSFTDMSASEWIWDRRLQRCSDVLMRPELRSLSVTEVAYQLGFNSSSHFSTAFRKKFGIPPSELRKR